MEENQELNINNKKRKAIILMIIILGLLAVIAIIYFIFFFNPPVEEEKEVPPGQNQQSNIINLPQGNNETKIVEDEPVKPVTKRELTEADLAKMAEAFAERFGSYSNHSNFGNIRDLKIFMTVRMQAWADRFISDQTENTFSDIYYGVTTKSISTETKAFDNDEGLASMMVSTQRRESTGSTNNTSTIYQDVLVLFKKENGSWKVDNATWQ